MAYAEPKNLTGMQELFNYADNVSGGKLYPLIPVSLFITLFLWLKSKGFETPDCLMASSFSTMIVTVLLYFVGAFPSNVLFYTIAILFVSASMAFFKKKE